MQFIESIVINGINKDVSANGLDYSGRKIPNPVRDVLNARYFSGATEEEFRIENIKSTIEKTYSGSTTAGISCVGTYANEERGIIIFFIHQYSGTDRVLKYDVVTDTITSIVNGIFGFDPRYPVTGVSMIGDILTFTNGKKETRYLNITKSYGTLSTALTTDQRCSLKKLSPQNPPTISSSGKTTLANANVNQLTDNNFQFAYQYVYFDDEVSEFSPFSQLLTADTHPDLFSSATASVSITFPGDSVFGSIVKSTNLLFRKNNDPQWYKWAERSGTNTGGFSRSFSNSSGNTAVATSESGKLFDQVPNKSKALTSFKNRIILNVLEDGFDEVSLAFSSVTLVAHDSSTQDFTKSGLQRTYFKKNGRYSATLYMKDALGRFSPGFAKQNISGQRLALSNSTSVYITSTPPSVNRNGYKLSVQVSGVGIPNGKYFVAITEDQVYQLYAQVPAFIYFYKRTYYDSADTDSFSPGTDINAPINPKLLYLKVVPTGAPPTNPFTSPGLYSYIHLQIPTNLDFVPDTDCYVRIIQTTINGAVSFPVEKVKEVIAGQFLVVGNFGVINWQTAVAKEVMIEIFKLKNGVDPFFHTVAGPFNFDAEGNPQTPVITQIGADTYYNQVSRSYEKYRVLRWTRSVQSTNYWTPPEDSPKNMFGNSLFIEERTPHYKLTEEASTTEVSLTTPGLTVKAYKPDLTKSAWSKGHVVVEKALKKSIIPTVIRFSNPLIEGTNVNGLNSFPAENQYSKIGEDRSPIVKLVPTGNIILAVHERSLSSLYIEESFINAGLDNVLSKTTDFIGDDRRLNTDFGSVHPESVSETNGEVFGWDIFNGVVWKYTTGGVFNVSRNGMNSYFIEKARLYLDKKDELRFCGSIDKKNKEYILTLPDKFESQQTVTAQTISPTSGTINISLNPVNYTNGSRYRVKISIGRTSAFESPDPVTVAVTYGTSQSFTYSVRDQSTGSSPSEALTPLYVYFTYATGANNISINITSIAYQIKVYPLIEKLTVEGETWGYNYEKDRWVSRYSFVPEFFGSLGNKLISFKNGRLYKHNEADTYNSFYGVQYEREITFDCNATNNEMKTWSALHVNTDDLCADVTSDYKVIEVINEYGQETYVRASEFDKKENRFYAPILKDINTNPALLSGSQIALRNGKDMRSESIKVTLHNNSTGRALLQKVNIVGEFSEFST